MEQSERGQAHTEDAASVVSARPKQGEGMACVRGSSASVRAKEQRVKCVEHVCRPRIAFLLKNTK
jgi:hypothetical protein